eukprot:6643928-Pyramimonas_sp.AAC.1
MALPRCPRCKALIAGRAWACMPNDQWRCDFDQLKYYRVDNFHARGHAATCPRDPLKALWLRRRVIKINAAAAEQLIIALPRVG